MSQLPKGRKGAFARVGGRIPGGCSGALNATVDVSGLLSSAKVGAAKTGDGEHEKVKLCAIDRALLGSRDCGRR